MVEQAAVNRKVEGSSPSSAAKFKETLEYQIQKVLFFKTKEKTFDKSEIALDI